MSLEALPGKKAINQKESTLGLARPCWSGGGGDWGHGVEEGGRG